MSYLTDMTTDAKTFMTALKQARYAAGLSQVQFARKVGVRQSTVSAWEAGEFMPRATKVLKVARVLRIKPHELARFVKATAEGDGQVYATA